MESRSTPAKRMSVEEFMVLAQRYLAGDNVWNDDDFFPAGGSKKHLDAYRKLYTRYFNQIINTHGFDIEFYPGDAPVTLFKPYLAFDKEIDMLRELAKHAIQEHNDRETSEYKYQFMEIEKVNFIEYEGHREFLMTVLAENLTLVTSEETFHIHAYKGLRGENIVIRVSNKTEI